MFKRTLGIAAFCGLAATAALAGESRPVRLVTYFMVPGGDDHAGLRTLATQYDAVILHEWSAGKLAEFRQANPQLVCLLYKSGMGLHVRNDVESVEFYDNVINNTSLNSSSWFQTDSQGNRISWDWDGNGTVDAYAMRPESTGWQQFFAQKVITDSLEQGWDGVFADDLWTYRGVYGAPSPYSSDAQLQQAMVQFLRYQQNTLHQYGLWFTGNIGWFTVNNVPVWQDYMAHMDAGMQEKFSPEDPYQWYTQMNELTQAMSRRHHMICIRYGAHDNMRRALYSFCNALLVTDGSRLYYGYIPTTGSSRQPPYYSWYDRASLLGRPMGPLTVNFSQNYGHRRFLNGHVYVNPTSATKTIPLPAGVWYNQSGQPVTSVTLAPYSGDFVLNRP